MTFLGPDFLLDTPQAQRLFHEVAADLPIVDYHNHLVPAEIAQDRHWPDLGELWLGHDHYKWRVMRWAGIEEDRVTGAAPFRAKFDAFAQALPMALGNPVHHWSHLELWRYFGLEGTILSPRTAPMVWDTAAGALARPDMGARGLLRRMNVRLIGTTDDPLDTLDHHAALAADPAAQDLAMVPTFRPDRFLAIGTEDWPRAVADLGAATGAPIRRYDDLVSALLARLDHFCAHGCRAADHGIDLLEAGRLPGEDALNATLGRALSGDAIAAEDAAAVRAALFRDLGRAYAARDLVMQLHIGALRNTRTRLMQAKGRDAGADSIRDRPIAEPLNILLDRLDRTGELPRTVLYCLDPNAGPVLVTAAGNFQDGSRPGKVQAGTAWWFNDQLDGMDRQITDLAQMGLISTFLGMLTDSRSVLSFPRHEYFRRLVARRLGRWMTEGHVPDDWAAMAALMRAICHDNAARWFA